MTTDKPVVVILRPPVPAPPPLEPCAGTLNHYTSLCDSYKARRAKSLGVDDGSCGRRSAIRVDGKPYCMVHGSKAALAYLIKLQDEGVI